MGNDQDKTGLLSKPVWTFINVVVAVVVGVATIAVGVAAIFVSLWIAQHAKTNDGLPTPTPLRTYATTPSLAPTERPGDAPLASRPIPSEQPDLSPSLAARKVEPPPERPPALPDKVTLRSTQGVRWNVIFDRYQLRFLTFDQPVQLNLDIGPTRSSTGLNHNGFFFSTGSRDRIQVRVHIIHRHDPSYIFLLTIFGPEGEKISEVFDQGTDDIVASVSVANSSTYFATVTVGGRGPSQSRSDDPLSTLLKQNQDLVKSVGRVNEYRILLSSDSK